MDELTPEELAGCIMCDREFLCSELVEEFIDDVANLQKVKVRLMHSGKVIETFRNCCEFTEKFSSCSVHSQSMENTVSGIDSQGVCYENSGASECINTAVFSYGSDSDWEDDCPVQEVSSGSESSDCETFVEQCIQEDLPRLGLLKWDELNKSESFERQFSDENWPSHTTKFSHDTSFKGPDPEPVPSWFFDETGLLAHSSNMRPIDVFPKVISSGVDPETGPAAKLV
ncbi:hypothetical protein R1sor_021105 [Riccia sorocarpa]|uniref:Uncharacterized protein n=1 Tax=Riccia sorocarpa TaxID=122646 RepID=A0ABD3GI74_9MARC